MAADKQQESLTVKGRFWQRHLQRWRQSGLSQVQYCRRHQLSPAAFGWWKGRLSATGGPAKLVAKHRTSAGKKDSFAEVTLGGHEASAAAGDIVYEIVLSRQRYLRLGPGFEPERVRQLLEVLEGAC
jgi:hypothetical protein